MTDKKEEQSLVTIVKKADNPNSQQAKENKSNVGTRPPAISFKTYLKLYEESFVTFGLTNKIATAINSGFQTKNNELMTMINSIDHEFLNRNKVLCGNAFFEVIEDKVGKVTALVPILVDTIEIMESGDGYVQTIGTDKVYFNAFTPKDKRIERKKIWEASQASTKELINTAKGCGFNPNINQVYQFNTTSLSTKYYGSSNYDSCIDQLLLIELIDRYYSRAFDNGMIKAKMIFPTGDKKAFSKGDKEILKQFIASKMKGVDKSFSTAILDQEVGQLNLEHDIDADAFIGYRKELLKSVSIALNVPYDLLLSDNSNRSASQISMETFNTYTIYPQQVENLKDFKILFAEGYTDIDKLEYQWIDTKDGKEEMEILTGYKRSGIMTANEVRIKIGLPTIDGGDALVTDRQQPENPVDPTEVLKKSARDFNDFMNDLTDDTQKNL